MFGTRGAPELHLTLDRSNKDRWSRGGAALLRNTLACSFHILQFTSTVSAFRVVLLDMEIHHSLMNSTSVQLEVSMKWIPNISLIIAQTHFE
jgi:hypothetical protein